MDRLLNTKASSERASRRKKRGEALIDQLVSLGLTKKTKNEDGFLIQGNNLIPELKSVFIEAPAGLITVFGTYYGMQVYEADGYTGAVYSFGTLSTYDFITKRYIETGSGVGEWYSILIQGQKTDDILAVAPYSNMATSQFLRNGSFYNTTPIGIISPSYQYPDSWPTAGVFPCVSEQVWLSLAGTDLIYNSSVNADVHHEIVVSGHLSKNSLLGGRTMFSEQVVSFWRPTATAFPLPVSSGYREVRPVRYMDYPFGSDSIRYFGTIVEEREGVLSYDRIPLDKILPDINDPPETHTGSLMPEELRNITLTDPECSLRPSGAFVAFSGIDKRPIIFTILDYTSTEQLKHSVYPPGQNSSDQEYFDNNIEERKWRISCHCFNMETG